MAENNQKEDRSKVNQRVSQKTFAKVFAAILAFIGALIGMLSNPTIFINNSPTTITPIEEPKNDSLEIDHGFPPKDTTVILGNPGKSSNGSGEKPEGPTAPPPAPPGGGENGPGPVPPTTEIAPPKMGTLQIDGPPYHRLNIFVDGLQYGNQIRIPLPYGTHKLRIISDKGTFEQIICIQDSVQTVSVSEFEFKKS